MENLIKNSNTQNSQFFAKFSKVEVSKKQLKNIKGGNGDGGSDNGEGDGSNGIITEDEVIG